MEIIEDMWAGGKKFEEFGRRNYKKIYAKGLEFVRDWNSNVERI